MRNLLFCTSRQNIIYKVSFLSFYASLLNALAGKTGLEMEGLEKKVKGEERVHSHAGIY